MFCIIANTFVRDYQKEQATDLNYCNRIGKSLVPFPEHCNDFGDEQGEDEKGYREKDLKRD